MEIRIEISNMQEYAWKYKYVVFRNASGSAWFYGAYDSLEDALDTARKVDGAVAEIVKENEES